MTNQPATKSADMLIKASSGRRVCGKKLGSSRMIAAVRVEKMGVVRR